GAKDVPAYVHPDDRDLLTDPAKGLSLGAGQQMFGGLELSEPDDVKELSDGAVLELAGLSITVDHAPGHTLGSVTFRTPPAGEIPDVMFSGDLLFEGSIGRTDLPGGSYEQILESLSRVCLTMPDETVVLPGHGGQTTIGRERAANPFLADLTPAEGPTKGF
ncbi:MBL fold metallo-hydrolase, partial [Actinomadura adrarensis]